MPTSTAPHAGNDTLMWTAPDPIRSHYCISSVTVVFQVASGKVGQQNDVKRHPRFAFASYALRIRNM